MKQGFPYCKLQSSMLRHTTQVNCIETIRAKFLAFLQSTLAKDEQSRENGVLCLPQSSKEWLCQKASIRVPEKAEKRQDIHPHQNTEYQSPSIWKTVYFCDHLLAIRPITLRMTTVLDSNKHTAARCFQGLRARDTPNLGVLSKALVSNSLDIVTSDLRMTSCCNTAPSEPWLLSFSLTRVRLSMAYEPPTVNVFSFVENFLLISPTAALFFNSSM